MSAGGPDPTVGWDADPGVAWQEFAPLAGDATADVCVVGLGGSGLAAIGDLLDRGLGVIGIDAGRVAAGAAGRNGGFLLGGPAQAVHEFAATFGADVAVAFYRETLREIDRLETLLGDDVILRVGSIRVAGLPGRGDDDDDDHDDDDDDAARQRELADCDAQYAFMRAHDLAVERYDGPLGTGLYFPRDAAMNPVRRAMGLAARYGARARLHEHTPAIAIRPGRVETLNGVIHANSVIVAVDGRLDALLPHLDGRVRTTRLQMAATAAVDPPGRAVLPCPVYANWGYDYLQQDTAGRIVAGGGRDRFVDAEWTADQRPTAPVQAWIDGLIGRVARAALIDAPRVTHRWAASVGYTPDSRPLVAEVDRGVVACGGYCGTGNLVGPIAARTAVALAIDGAAPPPYFAT
ncbi:MAG: oxidoreductase [Actinobacteria bacterium 69-20]|nr:MAG: oxidoreductase [Actinobacteria bacterium 69-20]